MSSNTTTPPENYIPEELIYTTELTSLVKPMLSSPIIRVYQNSIPWFGENRNNATLLFLGKILGTDYFIHPMSDLAAGIPCNTAVVLIPSNSAGSATTAAEENDPNAQCNLKKFVKAGGVLIIDMGDNLLSGGYIAPCAKGTPDLLFPNPCQDVTLTKKALKHPFANCPIQLNNNNIDMQCGCSVCHGNLEQGITLPQDSTVLMTATFDNIQRAVLAEYRIGCGHVILDTLTKEFVCQQPEGTGPSNILVNLFAYALCKLAVRK
ncbi:hypothetical protein KPL37_17410 [Clostridium frigoris]|uniref:Uncharacterized protein n=1 Tax=Clostridium frigoris TaxID=205327 RepID=A0ABS6BY01_9CLOT|nr:hypothetical protein [Clostridium frigoris]MBU3161487.1 hypothetical protein [Clostridium frigoris]